MGLKKYIAGKLARTAYMMGYDAAESTRHHDDLGWGRRTARSEDELLGAYDRLQLRQKCLDLRRNHGIVAGISERFSDNVVGSGIFPQAKTADFTFNDEAEHYFAEWSKICDIRGRLNWRGIQRLSVSSRIFAGDAAYIFTDSGQLQPIEGERINTPDGRKDIVDGIELDTNGKIRNVYIFNRDPDGHINTGTKDFSVVPESNIIYMSNPMRFDQVRGIPELAPVINMLRYFDDITKATLEKSKADAMMSWFIPKQGGASPANLGPRNASSGVGQTTYERFERGMNYYGSPQDGQPVSLASNTPNPQYVSFCEQTLRLIGAALGLPYEFLLLDFSKGSYSSSRAALLQTYRTFTSWQDWLTQQLNQRVWNWVIARAIKRGIIRPAPIVNGISQWYKVDWQYPEFGWVDPQSEATANQIEYNMCTNTVTQMNRKKGRDIQDVMQEKIDEKVMAYQLCDKAEQTTGVRINPESIIMSSIPGQDVAEDRQGKEDEVKENEQ